MDESQEVSSQADQPEKIDQPEKTEQVEEAQQTTPEKKQEPQVASTPSSQIIMCTGRRKTSVARVRLVPGEGTIKVNRKAFEDYFPREALRLIIREPLLLTRQLGKYDVLANVKGGGPSGQAGAIRLGIARALIKVDETLRPELRGAGLLTRDPRMKERKKYGQKGARKRFQWTKR